jgi:hypothetical protein
MIKNKNYLLKTPKNWVIFLIIEALQNLWKYKTFLDELAPKDHIDK